jgi:hypothetical protein
MENQISIENCEKCQHIQNIDELLINYLMNCDSSIEESKKESMYCTCAMLKSKLMLKKEK